MVKLETLKNLFLLGLIILHQIRIWASLIFPHIWDRVLLKTAGLTLKRHAQAVGHANSNTPINPT